MITMIGRNLTGQDELSTYAFIFIALDLLDVGTHMSSGGNKCFLVSTSFPWRALPATTLGSGSTWGSSTFPGSHRRLLFQRVSYTAPYHAPHFFSLEGRDLEGSSVAAPDVKPWPEAACGGHPAACR